MAVVDDSVSCVICGAAIARTARFCEDCGAPQDWSDPAEDATLIQAQDDLGPTACVDLFKRPGEVPTGRLWAGDLAPSTPTTPEPALSVPAQPEPAPAVHGAHEPAALPAGDAFCAQCGHAHAPDAQFCVECGSKRGAAAATPPPPQPSSATPPPAQTGPSPRARLTEYQSRLPAPFSTVPLELLAVCALMTLAGLLTLYPAARVLPEILRLLGETGFSRQIGLLLLTVWAMLALVGVALVFLAYKMVRADRVARGLAYVLLGGLGGAIAIGSDHDTALILAMLGCFAAIGVLALSPPVQAFFSGADAPDQQQPTSLVLARTLVATWAGLLIFVGVMFLPLDDLDGKFLPIGLLLIALGAAAWYYNSRLARGDETARALITIGAGVYLILLLVLGERQPGLILPLALAAGIVFNLWVPKDAQRYFSGLPPANAAERN